MSSAIWKISLFAKRLNSLQWGIQLFANYSSFFLISLLFFRLIEYWPIAVRRFNNYNHFTIGITILIILFLRYYFITRTIELPSHNIGKFIGKKKKKYVYQVGRYTVWHYKHVAKQNCSTNNQCRIAWKSTKNNNNIKINS